MNRLTIQAVNSKVKGLVINRFAGDGVTLSTSDSKVQGNFIGTKADGTGDLGNRDGVFIQSADNNTVGGGRGSDLGGTGYDRADRYQRGRKLLLRHDGRGGRTRSERDGDEHGELGHLGVLSEPDRCPRPVRNGARSWQGAAIRAGVQLL